MSLGDQQAFPRPYTEGMTLRQYFAALALQGELAAQASNEFATTSYTDTSAAELARQCVVFADALLAELSKPSGEAK